MNLSPPSERIQYYYAETVGRAPGRWGRGAKAQKCDYSPGGPDTSRSGLGE